MPPANIRTKGINQANLAAEEWTRGAKINFLAWGGSNASFHLNVGDLRWEKADGNVCAAEGAAFLADGKRLRRRVGFVGSLIENVQFFDKTTRNPVSTIMH